MVLHTPGGLVLAALQIAQAVRDHKSKVIVFVPHYAMSGGTLVALAADEIVMCKHSVLGPIDPQLGDSPAASLLKVVEQKPVAEIDDQTLIRADVGRKAIAQVKQAAADSCRARSQPIGRKRWRKARNRDMDTRLSDLGRNGEGARSASSHRHAERSPRTHVALPAARAHARRRVEYLPAPRQKEA